jgi:hypothetical protein
MKRFPVNARLHLRDLFWLTLAVAFGVGWGINFQQLTSLKKQQVDLREQYDDLMEQCQRLHDNVEAKGATFHPPPNSVLLPGEIPLRDLLTGDLFEEDLTARIGKLAVFCGVLKEGKAGRSIQVGEKTRIYLLSSERVDEQALLVESAALDEPVVVMGILEKRPATPSPIPGVSGIGEYFSIDTSNAATIVVLPGRPIRRAQIP